MNGLEEGAEQAARDGEFVRGEAATPDLAHLRGGVRYDLIALTPLLALQAAAQAAQNTAGFRLGMSVGAARPHL